MYRDHTQVERIKEKSDPHYGYSHLISMHSKELGIKLNRAIVENNASDYCCGQAQRLDSQMNRNSLICDLYQRRIHKKVLRKGRFCLNLIRESPIGRMP